MASCKVIKTYSRKQPWTIVLDNGDSSPTSHQHPPPSKSTTSKISTRTFKQRRIERSQRVLKSVASRRKPKLLSLSRILNTFTSTRSRPHPAHGTKPPSTASRQGRDGFSTSEVQIRSRPSPIVSVKHHKSFRRTPAKRSVPLFRPLELQSGPLPDVKFLYLDVNHDQHGKDSAIGQACGGDSGLVQPLDDFQNHDDGAPSSASPGLGTTSTAARVPGTSPCLVSETPLLMRQFRPYLPGVSPLIRQCLGFI